MRHSGNGKHLGEKVVGIVIRNRKKRGQEAIRDWSGRVSVLYRGTWTWSQRCGDPWKDLWLSLSTEKFSELMQEGEGEWSHCTQQKLHTHTYCEHAHPPYAHAHTLQIHTHMHTNVPVKHWSQEHGCGNCRLEMITFNLLLILPSWAWSFPTKGCALSLEACPLPQYC